MASFLGSASSEMIQQGRGSQPNAPLQPTPLIGRRQEIAAACHLLRQTHVRLLTLTGPAGVGKTRLALQVAAEMAGEFDDGLYIVPLAAISAPDLVFATIAQALGLREAGDHDHFKQLKTYLGDKRILLALDNFEQVVQAAPAVVELLLACSRLKVLVTSRVVLRLRSEYEFPVPPLVTPDLRHIPEDESLLAYEAIALFVQRAQASRPDFALTTHNARAVAELCVRLDGLPLALELAAARIKLLSPQAMLARLEQRLNLLTSGASDLPVRQQTLRNAIAWSYDLLNVSEQRLFRRLAAFTGGCALDAAEIVCKPRLAENGNQIYPH